MTKLTLFRLIYGDKNYQRHKLTKTNVKKGVALHEKEYLATFCVVFRN